MRGEDGEGEGGRFSGLLTRIACDDACLQIHQLLQTLK